tara:strand:+ start:3264 stop:3365 length:102 start_codon:yes stop_codon:yes gene_type:complete
MVELEIKKANKKFYKKLKQEELLRKEFKKKFHN